MAIIGGAGNPVGGSFTGPAEALEIVGDHAFAYSGVKATSDTPVNFLDFTTGNYYFVGKMQPVYLGDSTNNIRWDVKLNGQVVTGAEVSSSRDGTPYQEMMLIVPAYTKVEVSLDNLSGGTQDAGVTLTGRIYRTRD